MIWLRLISLALLVTTLSSRWAEANDAMVVPPTTNGIDDVTVLEDAADATVDLFAAFDDAEDPDEALAYQVTQNSVPGILVPEINGSTGIMTLSFAPNAFGSTSITVRATDTEALFVETTFQVTVEPVNDVPSFIAGANQTINEDAGLINVPGWAGAISAGPVNESSQTLTFNTSISNPALFTILPAINASGNLQFQAAPNTSGTATIEVSLSDNGGILNGGVDTSPVQSFTIAVNAINDPPTFTPGINPSVLEDSPPQTIPGWATNISPGPPDEATQNVALSIQSVTNQGLFTAAPMINNAGTLSFTPAPDAAGTSEVTIIATDNGGTANGGSNSSEPYVVTISLIEVNDPPAFTAGSDISVAEDPGAQSIAGWATNISAGPASEAGQTLTFNVSATNPGLFAAQPAVTAGGRLTFTPAENAIGSSTVNVNLSDNGGTANGGNNTSPTQSFTITVNPVNDPPTFTPGASPSILEDAGPQTIVGWATNISPGPSDEAAQTVTLAIQSTTNQGLFAQLPSITNTGTLSFGAAADAQGTSEITVVATDNGGVNNTSAPYVFTLTVNGVNDPPSFTKGEDITVNEGSGNQVFPNWASGISAGPPNENNQDLTFNVVADNPALFDVQPTINANGRLTFNPASEASGATNVTVRLTDNGGTANGGVNTSPPQTFSITIQVVNDPPVSSGIPNQNVLEDAPNTPINLNTYFDDPESPDSDLTYSLVANSNAALFSSAGITGASLVLDYAPDAFGSSTLTVRATDPEGLFTDDSFTVTVQGVNDPPSFTKGADQVIDEDPGLITVAGWATNILPGPANEAGQTLAFNVTSNNPNLFTLPPEVSATGRLRYQPATNATGSALVSVSLSDNGGTLNGGSDTSPVQTFLITIQQTNDPPTTSGIQDIQLLEDAPDYELALFNVFDDEEDADDQLSYSIIQNANPDLFTSAAINQNNGLLILNVAPNQFGTSTLTIEAEDTGGLTVSSTFTVRVISVNDAPTFTAGSNISISEDAPSQTIVGWATNILAGPENESVQTVNFTVENTSPELFAVQPALSPTGQLTYTPAPNASGIATLTITLMDNGGTSNEGINQSAPVTRTLTIVEVNDIPIANDDNYTALEGQALIASAGGSPPGVIDNDFDGDGDALVASIVTEPVHTTTWSFNTNGSFVYLHDGSENKTDSFTYRLSDGKSFSETATVTFSIKQTNDAPIAVGIPNLNVLEDAVNQSVNLFAAFEDPDDPDSALLFKVTGNSNPALFASTNINDATGTLVLDFAEDAVGSAAIIVQASDPGGLTAEASFTININGVNDPPAMDIVGDINLGEDEGPQTYEDWATNIVAGPANENNQSVSASISTNNTALFAVQPVLTIASGKGTLTFTPQDEAAGQAEVVVLLKDNGGTLNNGLDEASYSFTITISSSNDPPSSAGLPPVTVLEDAEALTYDLFELFDDAEDPDENLSYSIEGDVNAGLFAAAAIAGTPSLLTITLAENAFGSGVITVRATDTGGLWVQEDIDITINPVNDAPSFTAGENVSVTQNSPAQTIEGWATDILPGPENELDQTVVFSLTTDNDALFSELPTITSTGALSFAPAIGENVFGSANVTAILIDNGGTENGGVDQSLPVSFFINIKRFNTAPVANNDTYIVNQGGTLSIPAEAGVIANDQDVDNDPLTARLVTPPSQAAEFTLNADGSFVYRHNNTSASQDLFTYVLSDGIDEADEAQVLINIQPSGTLNLPDIIVLEDAEDTIVPLSPSFTPQFNDAATVRYTIQSISNPSLFDQVEIDSVAIALVLSYASNQFGSASIGIMANDLEGNEVAASMSVTVLPLNDPPIAVDDINATIENEAVILDVLSNDIDPDGDPLRIIRITNPLVGTVQPLPNGSFQYIPPPGFTGVSSFNYTIQDDSSSTDQASVVINVFSGQFDIAPLESATLEVSQANGINNVGEVVGALQTSNGTLAAFSSAHALNSDQPGTAFDINDFGQVVGATGIEGILRATRWDSLGQPEDLGAIQEGISSAYAINNDGLIVGTSAPVDGEFLQAVLWRDNTLVPLSPNQDQESQAFDVNDSGFIAGYQHEDALLWDPTGAPIVLPGPLGRAYQVNSSGQVAGSIDEGTITAVYWNDEGTSTLIRFPDSNFSEAYGINGSGWLVGTYQPQTAGKQTGSSPERLASRHPFAARHPVNPEKTDDTGNGETRVHVNTETRAFLWRAGTIVDLNDFIDTTSGWTLLEARAINNAAQIIGYGSLNGRIRAFLLTPSLNGAPAAADDAVILQQRIPLKIDILANDSDPDQDSLRIASFSQPEHGSVELVDKQFVTYTPGPTFIDSDSFVYTLDDGNGGTDEAQVTITLDPISTPLSFGLDQNYPNPFFPKTHIVYSIPDQSNVLLEVYNLIGQRVHTLVDADMPAGTHVITFDASDLPGGVYLYRIQAGDFSQTRKFTLLQ